MNIFMLIGEVNGCCGQETKTIKEIKKEWIQYYESILIYTPLNSLEYQIIYYSLFTLCQLSWGMSDREMIFWISRGMLCTW